MSALLRRTRYAALHNTRHYSMISAAEVKTLDKWINHIRDTVIQYDDEISRTRVRDLYYTLPTRNPANVPSPNSPISPLHCLAFFHPRLPEEQLGPDLTETHFCPPMPFGARRMWVGGAFQFPKKDDHSLRVGGEAIARVSVDKVEKKGFKKGLPVLFVQKDVLYTPRDDDKPIIKEKRVHAYLPEQALPSGKTREVSSLPRPQFTPGRRKDTLVRILSDDLTLSTFHRIRVALWTDLLVHGPLSALMLIEGLLFNGFKGHIDSFEYRARNPVYVDRRQHVRGVIDAKQGKATLWAEDDEGVVGMTGSVDFQP